MLVNDRNNVLLKYILCNHPVPPPCQNVAGLATIFQIVPPERAIYHVSFWDLPRARHALWTAALPQLWSSPNAWLWGWARRCNVCQHWRSFSCLKQWEFVSALIYPGRNPFCGTSLQWKSTFIAWSTSAAVGADVVEDHKLPIHGWFQKNNLLM